MLRLNLWLSQFKHTKRRKTSARPPMPFPSRSCRRTTSDPSGTTCPTLPAHRAATGLRRGHPSRARRVFSAVVHLHTRLVAPEHARAAGRSQVLRKASNCLRTTRPNVLRCRYFGIIAKSFTDEGAVGHLGRDWIRGIQRFVPRGLLTNQDEAALAFLSVRFENSKKRSDPALRGESRRSVGLRRKLHVFE